MLNADVVKEIYESKYFNWDDLKNYNVTRISPDIIKWEILADLISSKEKLFILIIGNPNDHYWELEQFADMIHYLGGHVCLNPFQCTRANKSIDELNQRIDSFKIEDPDNFPKYEIIKTGLEDIKSRVYDINCHMEIALYEQADVILVFNTDSSVKDEIETLICIDTIDATTKRFYKVICERDEGLYDINE